MTMKTQFEEEGYLIFNIDDPVLISQVNKDVDKIVSLLTKRTQKSTHIMMLLG